MANIVNYVTKFEKQIMQKYREGLFTTALTSPAGGAGIRFIDSKTVKVPFLNVDGYKDHSRNGGFNRQNVSNDYLTFTLAFDRDIEFFVDAMDVDETNQALAAANITNTFLTEQAIPETDCYRISKLYADWVANGGTADTAALTASNILSKIDSWNIAMDEAEVPQEGRMVYLTPAVFTALKTASGITRSLDVNNGAQRVNREIVMIDNLAIVKVPSARMKTVYNFTNGFVPGASALQINALMVHPKSVIAIEKHSYIKLWPEGTHTQGDGYLYQNRKYGDLFVIPNRKDGIIINTEAPSE
jgi:hypothetical protein